jgi:lysophospholipase L1-like esterase
VLLLGVVWVITGLATGTAAAPADGEHEHWVGTWATAQQLTPRDMPEWMPPPVKPASQPDKPDPPSPIPPIPERLKDQTVRMVARVSIGGRQLRIQLSNAQGMMPLAVGAAHVAVRGDAGHIRPASGRVVSFGGRTAFTIEPGAVIVSDPVDLPVAALTLLVVSLYVPGDSGLLTVHPLGLHTTYIADGNTTGNEQLAGAQQNRSYFWLTGIDVLAPQKAGAIVAFGDSITDGFATTPDTDHAWPALLAERLLSKGAAGAGAPRPVLNLGISGNRLLHHGAGTNALARFDRDVLSRPGVRWIVLLEGINDISFPAIPGAPPTERVTRDELIEGYRKFIEKAHLQGIKVIGATLLPWEGVWTFSEDAEAIRRGVNQWIRTGGMFDRVIDFDAVMRDPGHPRRLAPQFDSGDHVHPNDAGNQAMARTIDLSAFD